MASRASTSAGTARPAPAARRFHDLAESIAYQQLNGTAAATIWGRVRTATGEDVVTPAGLLSRSVEELRACGLSGSKTRSMLDLAQRVASGDLSEGHRFLAPGPFAVASFADYRAKLRQHKVLSNELGDYIERVVRNFVKQREDGERFAQWAIRADESDLR